MKSEIIETGNKSVVDWDKAQFVIDKNGLVVATNGSHKDNCFEGVCLTSGSRFRYKLDSGWLKHCFKPIPNEGITIKFTNE
jgi:hypothetical protein